MQGRGKGRKKGRWVEEEKKKEEVEECEVGAGSDPLGAGGVHQADWWLPPCKSQPSPASSPRVAT